MKYPNLKEEKKLWKLGYKRVAGLDEAGRGCERPDAEILTNNGWKFYHEITLNDKTLSYTSNGYIEWQKVGKVIEKDFEGNLIELKNRSIDIIVTPDHYFTVIRRTFKRDKKDDNKLKLVGYKVRKKREIVSGLIANDFIPRGGKWKGTNKDFFKLPKVDRNEEKLIDTKLWVAFLGIFLSEGSVSYDKKKGSYRITISQNENSSPKKYKKIHHLLKRLPFRFNKLKNGFNCYNKQLYVYLKQFGKRYDKFIPKDIKELPPCFLNILINWMILGDGACYTGKNRKKVCVYYTTSKKLRDDFEEILLKAEWTYHTNTRILKDRYIKGRLIKKENQVSCFEIRLRKNNKAQIKSLHKKKIFYKGRVFCLQLPKHHNFYVRRNGTGYFTGNSLAGPVVAAAVVIKNPKLKALNSKQIQNSKLKGLRISDLKLRDSKELTPKTREEFYKILTGHPAIKWGTGKASVKEIDKLNIKNASELAMWRALKKIKPAPDFLLIDGNHIKNPKLKKINHKLIVKGDEKVLSCSAASILAKVYRDRIMEKLHKKYPKYGFKIHKGYPTALHKKILKKRGRCPIHRKTFNF